jgi:crossover junction endodeoxyribonuclease RusA
VTFTVLGEPVSQGSLKAFVPKGWTRAVLVNASKKTKPWRQQVSQTCLEAMKGGQPAGKGVPIRIMVAFYFARPKSVKALAEKTTRPDLDKNIRLILDSLTGIAFADDSQVTELFATKAYGNPPRVEVTVTEVLPASKPYVRQPVKDSELPF